MSEQAELRGSLRSAGLGGYAAAQQSGSSASMSLFGWSWMRTSTYEVHSYYETGQKAFNKGKEYKVMMPMNAFGYHFSHDGIFFGYQHGMGGGGTTKINGRPDLLFKRMKPETVLTVTTGVQTEDLPAFLSNLNVCSIFPFTCQ